MGQIIFNLNDDGSVTWSEAPTQPATTPVAAPINNLDQIAQNLGFTKGRAFSDSFASTTLDRSKWNAFITSRSADANDSGQGWPWNAPKISNPQFSAAAAAGGTDLECFSSDHVKVSNGLVIGAEKKSTLLDYSWTSGAVCTYGKFEMGEGLWLIDAKIPDCQSGMWPGIWLLPGVKGTGGDRGEIDIIEGGFIGASNGMTMTYHPAGKPQVQKQATSADLSKDFHVYGLHYVPGKRIDWYLDGELLWTVTADVNIDPYQLLLTLQVASPTTVSWHSQTGLNTSGIFEVSEVAAYSA